MKIKTHRMNSNDLSLEHHVCEFCNRDAHYWTQAEIGIKRASACVFHCQAHRQQAKTKILLKIAS